MASIIPLLSALSPLAWIAYCAYHLGANYLVATRIGVPIIIIPISPDNPLWVIGGKYFMPLFEWLPFGNGNFTRFCRHGWQVYDRCNAHLELGDAFVAVTPGQNWLYVSNAESAAEILKRKQDFPRPLENLEIFNVFGPNISTVEGRSWQKQRKITTSSFNDRNMNRVWEETVQQAGEVLEYWKSRGSHGVTSSSKDIKTLTLHVLSSAGFGKPYSFKKVHEAEPFNPSESSIDWRDALSTIIDNAILVLILGPGLIAKLTFLKKLAQIHKATTAFKEYMVNMLQEEKHLLAEGQPGNLNLMTSLIRASAETSSYSTKSWSNHGPVRQPTQDSLRPEEVYGNMFVFSFAGHDTTSHTLTFAMNLLAAHPDVQEWMAEELRHYLGSTTSASWAYQENYPKMKRCLAVLYETLRLYGPVINIWKSTSHKPQTLTVNNRTLHLTANMHVNLQVLALHHHPRYWGDDAHMWRPSRWIVPDPVSSQRADAGLRARVRAPLETEALFIPPKGAFLPFSEGVRACPGQKFAQVEHVAAMSTLFRDHRVRPVRMSGETEEDARRRIMQVVEDKEMVLLLQMVRPERAALEWAEV